MKRSLILAGCMLALVVSGCAKVTCEKICKCSDTNKDDCVDDCKDDYKEGNSDCRKTMRELGDCIDDDGCDLNSCIDEAMDVLDDCKIDQGAITPPPNK